MQFVFYVTNTLLHALDLLATTCAMRQESEREKLATEAQGKIEEFENNLKEVLARKWKYL